MSALGDPPVYPREILRVVVGSTAHGIASASEDRDLFGVCIETPEQMLGLESFDHYLWRTQPHGVRSGPGDIDFTVYGLRKFVRMAVKGNPSILTLLYSPEVVYSTTWGWSLREMWDAFANRRAIGQFAGYMKAQRERLEGTRGGRHTNRPELEIQHGYDTKFAWHAYRLGVQGIEYALTGRFPMPLDPPDLQIGQAIRSGEMSKIDALKMIQLVEGQLMEAWDTSPLRPDADMDRINAWMHRTYLEFWYHWQQMGAA